MDSNHQLSQKPSSSLAMKGPLGKMEYRARFGDFWRRQKSSQIQDSMGRKIDMCFSFRIFVQKWPQAVPLIASVWISALWLHTQHQQCSPWQHPLPSLSFNVYVLIVPPLATTDTTLLGSLWWYLLLPLCPFRTSLCSAKTSWIELAWRMINPFSIGSIAFRGLRSLPQLSNYIETSQLMELGK